MVARTNLVSYNCMSYSGFHLSAGSYNNNSDRRTAASAIIKSIRVGISEGHSSMRWPTEPTGVRRYYPGEARNKGTFNFNTFSRTASVFESHLQSNLLLLFSPLLGVRDFLLVVPQHVLRSGALGKMIGSPSPGVEPSDY